MWVGAVPLTAEGALGSVVPGGTERVVHVRDDFEGHAAETVVQGTAADTGGIWQPLTDYFPSLPHGITFDGLGGCYWRGRLYNDATLPDDVSAEVSFTFRNAPEDNADIVAGLFLRGQPNLGSYHTGGYFVMADINQDIQPVGTHFNVYLLRSSELLAQNQLAVGTVDIGYSGTGPVVLTLRATVTGNRLQVWLNDVPALDYTDQANLFPSGPAGFWSNQVRQESVVFHYVEIYTEAPADQVLAAPVDWIASAPLTPGIPPTPPRRAEPPRAPGTRYTTRDGDLLDWVCWRHYGRSSGPVERVLEANPGLADWGPVLPAGVVIVLPDVPQANVVPLVRLWN